VWPWKGKGNPRRNGQGLIFEPDRASLPYLNEACSRLAEPKRELAAVPANQTAFKPDLRFDFV